MKNYKVIPVLLAVVLFSGCVNGRIATSSTNCKTYDIGKNTQNADPSGSIPSNKPIEGVVAEAGGITEVFNLEGVDMVVSFYPHQTRKSR